MAYRRLPKPVHLWLRAEAAPMSAKRMAGCMHWSMQCHRVIFIEFPPATDGGALGILHEAMHPNMNMIAIIYCVGGVWRRIFQCLRLLSKKLLPRPCRRAASFVRMSVSRQGHLRSRLALTASKAQIFGRAGSPIASPFFFSRFGDTRPPSTQPTPP